MLTSKQLTFEEIQECKEHQLFMARDIMDDNRNVLRMLANNSIMLQDVVELITLDLSTL